MGRLCADLLDAADAMPCIRYAYINVRTWPIRDPSEPPGHEQLVNLFERLLAKPFTNYTQQQQQQQQSSACAQCGDLLTHQYCYNTNNYHNRREANLKIEYKANIMFILRFGDAFHFLFQERYDEEQEEYNANGWNVYVNWMRVRAYEQQLLYLLQHDTRMHAFQFTSSMHVRTLAHLHVHGRAPVAIRAVHKATGKSMLFIMY